MSKQDNTVGNIAIGLAVVLLGFVVYKSMAGSGKVTYTGTPPTQKQTATAANPAALAASLVPAVTSLGSLFGSLNSYTPTPGVSLGGLDQAYTSTAWNPDSISADISSDTAASMAASGESDLNAWGFSL